MQHREPKISVVIPTLEEESYIEAILSRLKRVRPSVEIIVVDGGSRDRTMELAKRFSDKVYRATKQGIAAGRNHGGQNAIGDIIVFLDADVTFPVKFAEKVMETFKDPTIVGATCNIMPLKAQLGATTFFRVYNTILRFSTRIRPHSRGEFFAVRKTAFKKTNGFDETMPCLEDHDLAYRLSKLGRFAFISDLTVYESLRRFRKLGFWRVFRTWFVDYLSYMIRGKPVSQTWMPVR